MVTLEDVAAAAMAFPNVTEGERFGQRTWLVSGRAFAWERPFSKADIARFGKETPPAGPIVAVKVEDLDEKDAVLAAQPKAFFTIPHLDGYAAVLVQLNKVTMKPMREALEDAWLACAPAKFVNAYLHR